jgi:hypothetical protein
MQNLIGLTITELNNNRSLIERLKIIVRFLISLFFKEVPKNKDKNRTIKRLNKRNEISVMAGKIK